jgi:hypothetical protein
MDLSKFKLIFILIFVQSFAFGQIFVLSYKIVIKQNIVSADSLYISDLMVPSKKFIGVKTFLINSEKRDNNRYIIKKNREYILEVLFKQGIILKDFTTSSNLQARNQTTIILPPVYIAIDRIGLETYFTILKER